jgi:hypothetical protein
MKAITEFPNYTINKAITAKAALATEGKSPEEIQASLGETFKFEGDKLSHFIRALEVAEVKTEELKRVMVLSLNEGENAPPRAVKIEDHYYVPEFYPSAKPAAAATPEKEGRKGRGGKGGGKREGGPKSSPWGLTPEEKAAKGKKSK